MKNKWLVTNYYSDFKCKCDKCRHNCCHGWQIPLNKDEYNRLLSMECNNDLRHRLDVSFKIPDYIDDNHYRTISYNYLGDCPLNKDGLCLVHASKGEEMLPKVCRLYPRSHKRINDYYLACCSSSCEGVVDTLLNDKELELTYKELDVKPEIEIDVDGESIDELNHFEEVIKDSNNLLEGLMKVCLEVNEKEFINDYNQELNPLKEGLYLLNRLASDEYLKEITEFLNKRYENNYYQYEIDKKVFEDKYPNWNLYFKNVISNSIFYECFPFVDKRFDKSLAYKGLCASYGLLRLVCVGYTSDKEDKDDLVDCISALFHLIDHTSFYYNINIISKASAQLLKL